MDNNQVNLNSTPSTSGVNPNQSGSINAADQLIDNYRKPIEEKVGIPSDEAVASVATEQITGKSPDEAPPEVDPAAKGVRDAGHEAVNQVAPVAGKAAVAVGRGALAVATAGGSEAVLATPAGKYLERKAEGVVTNTIQNVGNQTVDELTASPDGRNGKKEGEDDNASQQQQNDLKQKQQQEEEKQEKKKKESIQDLINKRKRQAMLAMRLGIVLLPVLLIILPFMMIMAPDGGGYIDIVDGEAKEKPDDTTTLSTYKGGGTNDTIIGGHEDHGDGTDSSGEEAANLRGSSEYPTGSRGEKFKKLFPDGVPTSAEEMQKYLVTIDAYITTQGGVKTTAKVTCHKDVADDILAVTKAAQDAGFKIYSIGCFNWRGKNNGSGGFSPSDHAYGLACDINPNENYSVDNGKVYAGSFYKPGENEYSMPKNGVVVKGFRSRNWFWGGGDWSRSHAKGYYDYMHFSYGEH